MQTTKVTKIIDEDGQVARLVSLEHAAAKCGCSLATILRRVRSHKLPSRRVLGRVLIDERDISAPGQP